VSLLALVLIGVVVFVILGAVGVLILSGRVARARRREATESEPEDAW
jgi:hypothetical protein